MIESNIIKRHLVKCFMQNSESSIEKIAEDAYDKLSQRFLLNENVILQSSEESGKIVKCSKESYFVQLSNNSKVEVPFKEIQRRNTFDYSDVYSLLESITTVTPLGRILIENVFEKIAEPGFGGRKTIENDRNSYERSTSRGIQRRSERSIKPPVFQSVEIKNQFSKPTPKQNEAEQSKINFEKLKKLTVTGFEGKNLAILLKIYTFISAFKQDIQINHIQLEKLAEIIVDPEYNDDIIMKIHKIFIEAIEKDISFSGYRFLNEMSLCIDRLPQYAAEPIKDQKKKRVAIDLENWKAQVKNFIHNFSIDTGSDKPFRFVDCLKKDASVDIKLEFLDFLYKVFAYTDTFRNLVYTAIGITRANKTAAENTKKVAEEQGEDSSNTNEHSTFILDNPLIANIGRFRNFVLFMSDRSIILGDKTDFYILDQKEANSILRELNILSKAEKNTSNNLRAVTNELFNSK